jgi:hypothetical protein
VMASQVRTSHSLQKTFTRSARYGLLIHCKKRSPEAITYRLSDGVASSEVRADAATGPSNTALQAVLRLALFDLMHAMMRSTFGISELQSRNTSPMHALRSSVVPRAKLAVGKDIDDQKAITMTRIHLLIIRHMGPSTCPGNYNS